MSSIQEYWDALPRLTRGYMAIVLGTTLLCALGYISPGNLYLDWQLVISKFEIWRLLTCFFYFGKPSFMFLMQLMLIGRFGSGYESDPYRTGSSASADYLFSVLSIASLLLAASYIMYRPFLSNSLVFAVIYLWSKRNPTSPVSIWGFRLSGSNLPWAFIGLSVLLGNDPIPDLMGLAASHLFYFLIEVLPLKTGNDYLSTPGFVVSIAEKITGEVTQVANRGEANPWANQSQQQQQSSGHNWGSGQRLGS